MVEDTRTVVVDVRVCREGSFAHPSTTRSHETSPAAPVESNILPKEGSLTDCLFRFKQRLPSPTPGAKSTNPDGLGAMHEADRASEGPQHTQKLHINHLPPEVLQFVFLPVAGSFRGHYQHLWRLRWVCKYWKEVIDSTPEFWELIGSSLHPELQAMIIRNSRNRLLSVEFDETIWDEDVRQEEKIAAFASFMEPSASRWHSLNYRRALDSESDRWILSLPLHNVRRIEIKGPSWRDLRPTLDAPKLSILDVCSCTLNWRLISGLRVLILRRTNPTLNEFLAMLQASPGLERITLHRTWLEVESGDPPNSFPNKHFLPQLHTWTIYRCPVNSISFLLEWIEAPSLKTFYVAQRYENGQEDCTQLCESAGRYIGAFPLPQSKSPPRVSIGVRDVEFNFDIGGRRINIRHAWPDDDGPQPSKLTYLTSAMKHLDDRVCEGVRILHLGYLDLWREGVGEYLCSIHSRFPQIEELLLNDEASHGTDIGAIFQHLSSPHRLGLAEEWLLPKLVRLNLGLRRSEDTDFNRIAHFVSKRKSVEQTELETIKQLNIISTTGAIKPGIVESFRQSVELFDLVEAQAAT